MFSQDAPPRSDDAFVTRQVLTPSSPGSPPDHDRDASGYGSKKRKRDGDTLGDSVWERGDHARNSESGSKKRKRDGDALDSSACSQDDHVRNPECGSQKRKRDEVALDDSVLSQGDHTSNSESGSKKRKRDEDALNCSAYSQDDHARNSESGSKKRKEDGNTMEDLLKDSFTVKPVTTGSARPRLLQPLLLLPRANLPLSFLDITSTNKPLPPSRLFETHVKILELEDRMGTQPMVLIARLDDGRTLYAVERQDRGLYVLCQLGSWINLQQLRLAAVVSKEDMSHKPLGKTIITNEAAVAPLPTLKFSQKKKLAIEAIQSMVKRPSTAVSETRSGTVPPEISPEPPTQGQAVPEPIVQLSAPEIFDNVRNQYLETLYLSKATLAYFAKGPLSRARAAFHLDYDSTLEMNDYIAFLESLVLSVNLVDKKYRDGVPGCVSLIELHEHSADQENGKGKKRKVNRKMKPGKTGLYPSEEDFVEKWWTAYDDEVESSGPEISRESVTKNRISQLRIRETQLQMIVILEILALQPLATISEDVGDLLPSAIPIALPNSGKEKATKPRKPDHFTTLVDVHIDRLCIWQSISHEPVDTPIDGGTSLSSKSSENILRDFCVEVIIPFYSARLPERCASINLKFGGPVIASAPKPRQLSKSASFSGVQSRPGAATKRLVPAKPRRSLSRVLTDERERERRSSSHGHTRVPSFLRSATAPSVPGLKREASETPFLSNIPAVAGQSFSSSRNDKVISRFARREVSLGNLAPAANAKALKKAEVEAELKAAILALKKPNRELAGKGLAETAEKRTVPPQNSRKSKKPVRFPLFQGVQISATPKATRQKDMFGSAQRCKLPKMEDEMAAATIPPSSAPRIPDSVVRPSGFGRSQISSVQETPTRRDSVQMNRRASAGATNYLPSSPLQQRYPGAQTMVPDSAIKLPSFTFPEGVQDTPIKKRPKKIEACSRSNTGSDKENTKAILPLAETDFKEAMPAAPVPPSDSIYKSLGWDDDYDDELA